MFSTYKSGGIRRNRRGEIGEEKMKTKYWKLKNRLVANTLVNPRRLNINIEQRKAMIQLELPEFHKD